MSSKRRLCTIISEVTFLKLKAAVLTVIFHNFSVSLFWNSSLGKHLSFLFYLSKSACSNVCTSVTCSCFQLSQSSLLQSRSVWTVQSQHLFCKLKCLCLVITVLPKTACVLRKNHAWEKFITQYYVNYSKFSGLIIYLFYLSCSHLMHILL